MASTDLLLQVGIAGTATTLQAPGHTIGGTTFNVVSTNNWPTTTGVAFAVDRVSPTLVTASNPSGQVPGSYTEWVGDVTSGTAITGATLSSYSPNSDQNYPAAATTRVYIPVTATVQNRMVTNILGHANQNGSLKTAAVSTAITAGSITDAQLATGINANKLYNPAKFSVYRNGAASVPSGGQLSPVIFDTKLFDTGNNYSTTTGFFTAPVAGFYRFDAFTTTTSTTGDTQYVNIFKNGALAHAGTADRNDTGGNRALNVTVSTPPMQLALNDTVSAVIGHSGAYVQALGTGLGITYFGGYLISTT